MNLLQKTLRIAMLARGERLAEFLNYEGVDAQTAVELLEQLAELQGMLDRVIAKKRYIVRETVERADADGITGLWCWWAVDNRVGARVQTANRRLAKHGWEIEKIVKLTRWGPPTVPLVLKNPLRFGSGHNFGYLLRDCVEDRNIGHVRRCLVCERWFMASRKDQLHCMRRCSKRSALQRNPEEWRLYIKVYRRKKTIQGLLGKLHRQLKRARLSERNRIQIEITRLDAEYKALLRKKKVRR
jgi:hypothetical protein